MCRDLCGVSISLTFQPRPLIKLLARGVQKATKFGEKSTSLGEEQSQEKERERESERERERERQVRKNEQAELGKGNPRNRTPGKNPRT